jgi:hypothetical protein
VFAVAAVPVAAAAAPAAEKEEKAEEPAGESDEDMVCADLCFLPVFSSDGLFGIRSVRLRRGLTRSRCHACNLLYV